MDHRLIHWIQVDDLSSVLSPGAWVGGTENRSNSVLVHSCDLICTRFMFFNKTYQGLFSVSWPGCFWLWVLVPFSFFVFPVYWSKVWLFLDVDADGFLFLVVFLVLLVRFLPPPFTSAPCLDIITKSLNGFIFYHTHSSFASGFYCFFQISSGSNVP